MKLTENEMIYVARRNANLSQAQVAKALGFHQTAISKMEKGEIVINPKVVAWLDKCRAALRCDRSTAMVILRKRMNLKLDEAAKQYGAPPYKITDWENGRDVIGGELYFNWLRTLKK